MVPAPLRLRLDGAALVDNWRSLGAMAGTACGAAVKANGYGLGATEVATRLAAAGCRDFFVATWAEAEALAPLKLPVSVLHGVRGGGYGAGADRDRAPGAQHPPCRLHGGRRRAAERAT